MSERGEHNGHQMLTSLSCLTTEQYKKVARKATLKLDVVILLCLMTMYILNYLDRSNIAVTKVAGITEDLDLSPTGIRAVYQSSSQAMVSTKSNGDSSYEY